MLRQGYAPSPGGDDRQGSLILAPTQTGPHPAAVPFLRTTDPDPRNVKAKPLFISLSGKQAGVGPQEITTRPTELK